MKSLKKESMILLLIIFLVLYFVLKDEFAQIMGLLGKVNYGWVLFGLFIMALSLFFRAVCLWIVTSTYKKDYKLEKSIYLELVTSFFNGVTPFATGGQPMQIYFLKKDGVSISSGASIILMNFILYQAALVLIGLFCYIGNNIMMVLPMNSILGRLIELGFIINTLVLVFLLLVCFSKSFIKIMNKVMTFLFKKMWFLKKETISKIVNTWNEKVLEFHKSALFIKSNVKACFLGFVCQMIGLICLYAIPLFAFYSLHDFKSLSLIESLVSSAYTMLVGAFVPIPGGSGGIEYAFKSFFESFNSPVFVSTALLIWRSTMYYIPMIVGGILFSIRREGH